MIRTSSPLPAGTLGSSQLPGHHHADRLSELKASDSGFLAMSWPAPPSPVLAARPPTPPQSSAASDSRRIFLKKRRSSQLKGMSSVSLRLTDAAMSETTEPEAEAAPSSPIALSSRSNASSSPSPASLTKMDKNQRSQRVAALAQSLAAASQPLAQQAGSSTPSSPTSPTRTQNKAIRLKNRASSMSTVMPGQPASPYVSSPMVAVAYRSSAALLRSSNSGSCSSPSAGTPPIRRGSSQHDVPRPLARRDSKPQQAFPQGRPAFVHTNTDRTQAEQLLVADGMRPGTYLLREKTPNHAYALSFVDLQGIGHALITRAERSDGRIGMHWLINTLRLWECETMEDVLAYVQTGLVMPNHELDIPVLSRPLDAPDNTAV